MAIGDFCTRDVVTAVSTMNLASAARLMGELHVGSLVVVEPLHPSRPVGIITDRDIVTKVVAEEVDARTVTVGEVVEGRELACVPESASAVTALRLMRRYGVRRLPVLTCAGELSGIVALDDLIALGASAIDDVVGTITGEPLRERAGAR